MPEILNLSQLMSWELQLQSCNSSQLPLPLERSGAYVDCCYQTDISPPLPAMPPKWKAKDAVPIQKQKMSKNKTSKHVELCDHDKWTLHLLQLLLDKQHIYVSLFGGTQGKHTEGTTKIQHQWAPADLLWDCDEVKWRVKTKTTSTRSTMWRCWVIVLLHKV